MKAGDCLIHGELDMKSKDILLKNRGLEPYGKVQKFIDNEITKKMVPYTPMLSSTLFKSATPSPKIGSGLIIQKTPYARYQYYGKLMVDPITQKGAFYSPGYGFWSRPNVKKELTNKDLVHNKSKHPMAGPFWFERAKADHKEEILRGAMKIAGAKWK